MDSTQLLVEPVPVDQAGEPGADAVLTYPVTPGEGVFAGHYPGFPIFPGVCIVECAHRSVLSLARGPLRLTEIESTRFLGPAFPGDTLTISLSGTELDGGMRYSADVRTERGPAAAIRLRYIYREGS